MIFHSLPGTVERVDRYMEEYNNVVIFIHRIPIEALNILHRQEAHEAIERRLRTTVEQELLNRTRRNIYKEAAGLRRENRRLRK